MATFGAFEAKNRLSELAGVGAGRRGNRHHAAGRAIARIVSIRAPGPTATGRAPLPRAFANVQASSAANSLGQNGKAPR
jgi:hypothetical protein